MKDTNWKQMGRNLIAYVIWCGGHQLVFYSGESLSLFNRW